MMPKTKYAKTVSEVCAIVAEHITTRRIIIQPAKYAGEFTIKLFKLKKGAA